MSIRIDTLIAQTHQFRPISSKALTCLWTAGKTANDFTHTNDCGASLPAGVTCSKLSTTVSFSSPRRLGSVTVR